MKNDSCYICGKDKTVEWHSLWYDGTMRKICSTMCRSEIEELHKKHPEKRFGYITTESNENEN